MPSYKNRTNTLEGGIGKIPLGASVGFNTPFGVNGTPTLEGFIVHDTPVLVDPAQYPELAAAVKPFEFLDLSNINTAATPYESVGQTGGSFGSVVAATDNHIAVGSPSDRAGGLSSSGRVYVLNISTGFIQILQSPRPDTFGQFGTSVALTDTHLVVGASGEDAAGISSSGRVYIYSNTDGTFSSVQTYESPNPDNNGGFGRSVAITDGHLAVGASGEDYSGFFDAGRVYAYVNFNGVFGPPQTIQSPNPENYGYFGGSISAAGEHLAVGARGENTTFGDAGRVYVYRNSGGSSYNLSPQTLESPNQQSLGNFGEFVSLTDNYLAVGAPNEDVGGLTDSGRVYVYTKSGFSSFGSVQTIQSPNSESSGRFGDSVSITDSYLAIGAYAEDGGSTGAGRAYVYTRTGGTYGSVQTLESPSPESNGFFGSSVSITDNYLAAGANGEGVNGRVYRFDGAPTGNSEIRLNPQPNALTTATRIK